MSRRSRWSRRAGFCLSLLFLGWGWGWGASPLTQKSFRQDLAYYQRTAQSKHLNANDRLFILDRLRQKYKDAEFDLSDLYAEIDRCARLKEKEPAAAPGRPPTETRQEAAEPQKPEMGILTKALITDSEQATRLILESPGTHQIRDKLQKDPKGLQPPVLILYLHNTKEQLKPQSRNFRARRGMIRQVQSKLASRRPPVTEVLISLREDRPYEISQKENEIIVSIPKGTEPPPAAAPVAAAVPDANAAVVPTAMEVSHDTPAAAPTLTPLAEEAGRQAFSAPPQSAGIEPGDILAVRTGGGLELSQEVVVASDGIIRLPLVGEMRAGGLTTSELEKKLVQKLSEWVPHPQASIQARKFASKQIFLTGQVQSPGVYPFEAPLSCFEFISRSGGFLDGADRRAILVFRTEGGRKTTIPFNAEDYLANADPSKDLPLRSGDVVEVPRVSNFVFVMGAVKSQGRFELRGDFKLMQAIYQAGGFEPNARTREVRVIRSDQGKKVTLQLDAERILKDRPEDDILLKPGDLVLVPEKSALKSKLFSNRLVPWVTFIVSMGLVLALLI